jgi:hypothetical protein
MVLRRPSYAGVTSTLALFLAPGGGAYAAATLPANSVGARQSKKSASSGRRSRTTPSTRRRSSTTR